VYFGGGSLGTIIEVSEVLNNDINKLNNDNLCVWRSFSRDGDLLLLKGFPRIHSTGKNIIIESLSIMMKVRYCCANQREKVGREESDLTNSLFPIFGNQFSATTRFADPQDILTLPLLGRT
jgi:hypothetical protein